MPAPPVLSWAGDQLAATGLPIQATEMDIQGDSSLSQEESDQLQLENMQRIFPVFWEHPAVEGITFWGWRSTWMANAELIYSNGEPRPALQWLREYVENWESDSSD
jgi:endo-1,4-beta-xylanase